MFISEIYFLSKYQLIGDPLFQIEFIHIMNNMSIMLKLGLFLNYEGNNFDFVSV